MKKILKKIWEFIKKYKLYILTFLASLIILLVIYIAKNVTPFGDKSLLCIDFYHQYGPMLAGFWNKVHNFSNMIYSFNLGLGLPYYRNFYNYLSSPFNVIIMFFSHKNVITSYSFVIGFKAICSSLTMVYYLSHKFNKKELYLIPLGLIYAFSAYYQSYYWNIMWLDGMVFLPLITLGIENIVNKNKWKFYSIVLAIMLISNYFIGYMLCIYSVVYFIFYLIYKTNFKEHDFRKFFNKCFKFAGSSLIAGGLVAFALIPLFLSMKSISATGGDFPTSQYYDFTLIDFLKGHLSGITTTTFASDDITNPNVSAGILSIILLIGYLLNRNITIKNKICYLMILGFFILAFFYAPLDYILHAFHVPNDLPYRYSFIYTFILVVIGSYSLTNIKKIKYPIMLISYLLLMGLLFYIRNDKWSDLSTNMIYINMILLTLYFLFYSGVKYVNKFFPIFYIGFIVVTCIDLGISMDHNWDVTQVLSTFYSDYNAIEDDLNYIKKNDKSFYRLEKTENMTLNDGTWYDYNGVNTFSSMAYENMAILQHKLGIAGNEINSYYYTQTTPLYDLMFDVKYTIGDNIDLAHYTNIYNNEESSVYEFNDNVGLIYGVSDKLLSWNYQSYDPIEIENDYIYKSTGISDAFEPLTLINSELLLDDEDGEQVYKYSYENLFDNMYFYENNSSIDFIIIGDTLYYTNDSYSEYIPKIPNLTYIYMEDYDEKHIINISSEEDTIDIYVGYSYYYDNQFEIYRLNHEKWTEAYEKFNQYKFDMTSFSNSRFEGYINLKMNMIVYTSIPYDTGWHVYVDGKEVHTSALADSLLVFKVNSGTHKIKIVYKIPYFKISSLISIISLLIIVFSKKLDYIIKKIYNKYLKKYVNKIKMPKWLSKIKLPKINKYDKELNQLIKLLKKKKR